MMGRDESGTLTLSSAIGGDKRKINC